MSVSVLILTCNEERNLGPCLDSVAWSDDVVVLDSGSTDRTVQIAEERGTKVLQRPFDTFADQRNHGIDTVAWKHEWILHLDADERVPAALRDELESIATKGGAVPDAYRVASKLMFMERWIRHAGMYPVYQVRFGRRDQLRFKQVGHGQREELGADRLGTLTAPLVHEAFSKGVADWVERHNRYSSDEARLCASSRIPVPWGDFLRGDPVQRRRALKTLAQQIPCRGTARFLYMWLLRGGFLDGTPGWHYCRLIAWYESLIALKTRELCMQQR